MSEPLYTAVRDGADVRVKNVAHLDLAQTFDCGQAFRWRRLPDGRWRGAAFGRVLTVGMSGRDLILENTPPEEYERVWRGYFDLDRDYGEVLGALAGHPLLCEYSAYAAGIRVLNQDAWETLCTFIISQNNNIPRIRGIVERFCEAFGADLSDGFYAFPDARAVAAGGLPALAPLRAGFRAKYLLDAAERVAFGALDLCALRALPLDEARRALCGVCGVGPKVADCVLLFGAGRVEAFPQDVWIKRVMAAHFPEGLPPEALPFAGIVQQYLFHAARRGARADMPPRGRRVAADEPLRGAL